jgi:hypothetical protein
MVEVLVASTILIVLVMMLGMLFQQTSLTWRIGVKRADGFMKVRAVIGAIQRDASAAVDARSLPPQFLSGAQRFSGSELVFYTLTGKGEDNKRVLTKVIHDTGGRRTESVLQASGSWGPAVSANLLSPAGRANTSSSLTVDSFEAEYGNTGDTDPNGLPLFITFQANVSFQGANLDIGAASAGPDRTWNTKDDIRTWVK